jgi:O-antigen/teichoic acid export membrane protein
MLPTKYVHERLTQNEQPTQREWALTRQPSLYAGVDSFVIGDQVTWMLPAIAGVSTIPRLKGQESGENYTSFVRHLVRNSGMYALSSLAVPFVSLTLSPLLTHSLTSDDYGALAILTTMIALLAGISQLGLSASFFRAYNYDYESRRDRRDLLSTAMILIVSTSLPITIIIVTSAPWLASPLLSSSSFTDSVKAAGIVLLFQNLTVPGFSWLRAENRVVLFTSLSITNLLVNAGTTILLLGTFHMGIVGSLVATGCGYAVVVLATMPLLLLRSGIHLRLNIARELLAFGLPHVMNLVAGWILQLSDRYLLSHLGSLSQAASYAVAYSLGGALSSLIISPFSLAWFPAMFSIAKKSDASGIFQLVFRWYAASLLFSTLGLSFLGISVLDLFFPPAYHADALVIPVIALSTAFSGIYVMLSIGVSIQRKPWLATLFTTISALLNVGLNVVLIPLYGAMGAAIATLVAYIVFSAVAHLVSQQLYPVPFEVGLLLIALLVGCVLFVDDYFLAQLQGMYGAWTVHSCTLGLYGGFLVLVMKLTPRAKSCVQR